MIFTRHLVGWFALLILAARCVAGEPEPAKVRDVTTWGDLLAQKPGRLVESGTSGVITYRLGIDRTDAKLYGGVVVHCLLEGGDYAKAIRTSDATLGPFSIQVKEPKGFAVMALQKAMEIAPAMSGSNVWYMTTIPLCHPGIYTIEVRREVAASQPVKFETVAATNVEVSGSSGQNWTPWPQDAGRGNLVDGDANCVETDVTLAMTGIAVPKWDGWRSVEVAEHPDAKMRLPRLLPQKPDTGVRLVVKGSVLDVRLDEGIEPNFPDKEFLSRWWVNGKLIAPKIDRPRENLMRENGAMFSGTVKEVRFHVGFRPEILGVKKGDKVGVQVLVCSQGIEYSGPEGVHEAYAQLMERAWAPHFGNAQIARVSNRVDFVYSGDPAAMAGSE